MIQASQKPGRPKERGAALLTVLVALMIITILLFEFQYAAMVERKLAYNDLNQTQAYYLAKAGARMGILRVALYARLKNNPQIKSMVKDPNLLNPFFDQIWQLPLPPFPPSAEGVGKLFKADRDAAEKVLSQTKIQEGQYSVSIRGESSKINLNSLIVPESHLGERPNFTVPPTRPDLYSGLMLVNLLDSFLQESNDPFQEYPDLRPEELVTDIMDWVSPGDNRLLGGSKDAFYEQQNPAYKAKRGRFFTLEELRLVRGMTEPLFQKLKPHITVYSYQGKINLNTATARTYRAIYKDFTEDDLKRLIEHRDQIGGWASEAQFVDYVTDVLGRPAFKTQFPRPAEYPFTIATESFLIESLGVVQKSASSVQRTIKVAVAFSGGKGGEALSGKTEPECKKLADHFWHKTGATCYSDPRTEQECRAIPGEWFQQGSNQFVCKVFQTSPEPPILRPIKKAGGKGGGSNALKVLNWYES